jgi:outer membrane protein assembly factor BamE (lipoprotein component of BamABCDE complex)
MRVSRPTIGISGLRTLLCIPIGFHRRQLERGKAEMLSLSANRTARIEIQRKFVLLAFASTVVISGILLTTVILNKNIKDLMKSLLLGEATVYANGFSDYKFRSIKVGMKTADLRSVMGPPLKRAPWGSFPEVWFYTDQRTITDNFWRRWVVVDANAGEVVMIIDDFWDD